ncbi:Putative F-box protein At3g16210 [Linum grandiflorum]
MPRPIMSGDGGEKTTCYFSDDIVINILQCLPIVSCIARFRCVCRSWRTLLSDPNVIIKILFHKPSNDEKKLQILISGYPSSNYMVHSYETLRPIEELAAPVGAELAGVVECCDGIFCLAGTTNDVDGNHIHTTVLWNPATSETKIIPPGPYHPCHGSRKALDVGAELIGFGYDPKTDDYKVIRVMEFEESTADNEYMFDYDPAQFYHGPTPLIFTEVYSLRNNSWKTLNVDYCTFGINISDLAHCTQNLNQQWDSSRNEKCYWFCRKENSGVCVVISFDMSTELFEFVDCPHPTGLTHHDDDQEDIGVDDPLAYAHKDVWYVNSCFMLKGVIMVSFSSGCFGCSNIPDDEIWVLLKYGVAESWTKLFAWPKPRSISLLEVWKDGAYICAEDLCNMSVRDITTGEVIREHMEIEGATGFLPHIFAPTQVSMSRLVNIREE